MLWRPDDWHPEHFSIGEDDIEAYEAGASAMLEGLINNPDKSFSQYVPAGLTVTEWSVFMKESGYLVFIPEEVL